MRPRDLRSFKRLKPLTAVSGTVYRLASSMSDHTPVLFNVFEDWNDESVVPHISFYSIRDSIRTQTTDSHVPNATASRILRTGLVAVSEESIMIIYI